jgi:hypothetical protein
MSKAKVIDILRQAGYAPEMVDEIASQLSDPVDLDKAATVVGRYGIILSQIIDRFGGSP